MAYFKNIHSFVGTQEGVSPALGESPRQSRQHLSDATNQCGVERQTSDKAQVLHL